MTTLPITQALGESNGFDSIAAVRGDIAEHLPGLVNDFERRWAAAHAELSAFGGSSVPTLSDACDRSETFNHIKKLGPKIVPLVVDKLASGDNTAANLWAVLLYDALESDENYRIPQTDLFLCRTRITELNIQRNRTLADQLPKLVEAMGMNSRFSTLSIITTEKEFLNICDLGKSIMTPVMLAYLELPGEPWFHLVHEIVHGQPLQAKIFQPGVFLGKWEEFFNNGEADEAPVYKLSPMERYVYYKEDDVGEFPTHSNGVPVVNTSEQFQPRPRQ